MCRPWVVRVFLWAAIVAVSVGVARGQPPPLADLQVPPSGTARSVLFCPNCIPPRYLIEISMAGLFVAIAPADPPVPKQDVDLDLIVKTPYWQPGKSATEILDCKHPLPVAYGYNFKTCVVDGGRDNVGLNAPGWFDHFGPPDRLYQTELFFAGRGVMNQLAQGAEWCIQPIVEKVERVITGTRTITGEMAITLDGGNAVACRFPITFSASAVEGPRLPFMPIGLVDAHDVARSQCQFGTPPELGMAAPARVVLEGPSKRPRLVLPEGPGAWTCCNPREDSTCAF